MVQISSNKEYQGIALSAICTVGAIFCMIITVLGIKFKWFRRRLELQQVPESNGRNQRRGRQSNDDILSYGVFRKRTEDDVLTEIERPETLPPIRVRNSIRNFKIPLPHETRSLDGRPVSQPSRPTVPPPIDIPRPASEGALTTLCTTQQAQINNGNQIEGINVKKTSFRKNETSTKRLPAKFDYRNNSVDQTDQNTQRRPTGIVLHPPEKDNLENSFVKNYSDGFGMSSGETYKNQSVDLLTSIEEKSPDYRKVTLNLTHFEFESHKSDEDDLLEVIKIPKPEPRRSLTAIQSTKTLEMAGTSKMDTEV